MHTIDRRQSAMNVSRPFLATWHGRLLIAGGVVMSLLACGDAAVADATRSSATASERQAGAGVSPTPTDRATAMREELAGLNAGVDASPLERRELRALYDPATNVPLWFDDSGRPSDGAAEALTVLRNAASEGLVPADYHAADLDGFMAGLTSPPEASTRDVARIDVGLSLGMLRFLRHLHLGRVDPRRIGFRMNTPLDDHDFPQLLREAVASHRIAETVAALTPPLVQYRSLRTMLPRYRALATDSRLAPLPVPAASVHPGESYAGVAALHAQLAALGDLPPDAVAPVSTTYDEALVDGVTRFQVRHGLAADGVLGRSTVAALRTPLSGRVRQIELALERLRWLPHLGDRRFIALNIPMFHLWAWDTIPPSGAPSFGMDVVVGRALNTQTPVFAEEMRYVIFRPYWNIPSSILRHEILPALQRDGRYLERHDMEIVNGAGDDARPVPLTAENLALLKQGRLRMRQRPGPRNSLGLIKFMFPNDANVYMHDTPAQALFSRSRRDFSHGCVRLQDPVGLAEWVLRDQPEWTRDRIVAAMSGSVSRRVDLTHPIQVILYYVTAVVMPEDGTIRFAEDIYGHDTKLDRALQQRRLTRSGAEISPHSRELPRD